MTKNRISGLFFRSLFLFVLTSCSSPSVMESPAPGPGIAVEAGEAEPQIQRIAVPSSPRIAPSDILDQVVFEGTGGPGGERWCPCVYVEGNLLYLEGFSPNQSLRLVAYDEYEQYYGEYYSEWLVDVGPSGSLALAVDGYEHRFTFIAFHPTTGKQVGPVNRRVFPNGDPVSSSDTAQISYEVEEVNLRRTPGYLNKDDTHDVITRIPAGTTVEILGGPISADGLDWWTVSWNGREGYIADRTGSGRTILIFNP